MASTITYPALPRMAGKQLWDQQTDESDAHFALFWDWREAKCPGLSVFRESNGLSLAVLREIAGQNEWRFRVRAWNAWRSAVEQDSVIRTVRKRERANLAILDQFQDLIQDSLERVREKGDTLKPSELIAAIRGLVQAAQLLGGGATERMDLNVKAATDESLAELQKALEGMK